MSNRADTRVWRKDGNLSFKGGQDASQNPADIDRDQVQYAVNATFRGAKARPRPGYIRRGLSFSDGIQSAFRTGLFQHGSFYDGNGSPALISSHGGRIFKIDLASFSVQEITPVKSGVSDPNSSTLPIGWSIQAENYWIYQDNQSYPIIFNGSSCRRANAAQKEIPVGNVMAYAMGRVIVALPDRQTFRVGDLVFGSSGTPEHGYRDSILRFTENDFLNEGGDFVARVFGAPSNAGQITAMKACAMTDAQLGQGPLLVGTPFNVFTVNLPFDRTVWKNLSNALQTANPINGPLGQSSSVLVNTDLSYRSLDGIRSYVMARREFTTYGNTPLSTELGEYIAYDNSSLLEHGSAVLFDNRMLMTVSPVQTERGVYHRGLVSLDYHLISNMRKKLAPAWEGLWTGLRILHIVTGLVNKKLRCFVYALNDDDEIELWEIDPDLKADNGTQEIEWSLDMPAYNCGDSDRFKRLETGRIIVENISGDLTGTVKYRSDAAKCYQTWATFTKCATVTDCAEPTCDGPHTYLPQPRFPIKLNMPPDDFDEIQGVKYRTGYEFQPRLELKGYGEIRQFRIYCIDEPETLAPEPSLT